MGDNDFPTVMANGGQFLQGFMKKKGMISQQETGQPAQTLSYESQQMLGGPEIAQVSAGYGPEIPASMVGPVTERVVPGYTQRRDALRQRIQEILRGV